MPPGYRLATDPQGRVVGVVLAGGASRRFGSDKLAAELGGRPLVVRAIEAVRAVDRAARVVVVGPAPPAEPAWLSDAALAGADVVRDAEPYGGPLAGLATGLGALAPDDVALVVGGDMPALDPVALGTLVDAIDVEAGRVAAFVESSDRPQPLPCALVAGPGLEAARRLLADGVRALAALAPALGDRVGLVAIDRDTVADVDTPSDLERLRT